jgi:hypothetical protein
MFLAAIVNQRAGTKVGGQVAANFSEHKSFWLFMLSYETKVGGHVSARPATIPRSGLPSPNGLKRLFQIRLQAAISVTDYPPKIEVLKKAK